MSPTPCQRRGALSAIQHPQLCVHKNDRDTNDTNMRSVRKRRKHSFVKLRLTPAVPAASGEGQGDEEEWNYCLNGQSRRGTDGKNLLKCRLSRSAGWLGNVVGRNNTLEELVLHRGVGVLTGDRAPGLLATRRSTTRYLWAKAS